MKVDEYVGLGDTLVHGGANGLDSLAGVAAYSLGRTVEVHRADWATHGKSAGPLRNKLMADLGAQHCVAFLIEGLPCKGTRNMIEIARRTGIPTSIYTLDEHGNLSLTDYEDLQPLR